MGALRYVNQALLEQIDTGAFRARQPFPWLNPQYFIAPEHYPELLDSMPDIAQFRAAFYGTRKHGQKGHDRYVLDYEEGMSLAEPWQQFIDELRGDTYREFVCQLLKVRDIRFRFHWHYTPAGCEVSPHCDSRGKLGSQIFYLNTERDWQPEWGGETVILDDEGEFPAASAPQFADFKAEYAALTADNRSLLFARRGNSWHGVRAVQCPEGYFRKVFIVVFEAHRPLRLASKRLKRILSGKPPVTDKERMMY
ncbi:2OG-Fe(II) oxygenase [Haliea sp. E17]|uniref:2OG-Fe(II) oxygenase n=1 Tax=Haliea sp. E17 TaxID=3401576 RepID=UPI003AAABE16